MEGEAAGTATAVVVAALFAAHVDPLFDYLIQLMLSLITP